MTRRMVLMLALLALIFGGIFAYKWDEKKRNREFLASYVPPPVVISAVTVDEQVWQREHRAIGTLTAVQSIEVSSEADGMIRAIHFDSGDVVQQGDRLIELDDEVESANLRNYHARLNLARINFDRDRQMLSRKLLSQERFDRSNAELDEAMALVEQTEAVIAKKNVKAPFSGRLGIRMVSIGEYLAAGEPATTLQSVNPIFVDFSLPEQYLPDIHVGQKLSFAVKAYPIRFEALVTAIDARVSTETRNIDVRAVAGNADERLVPGMFAEVKLDLGPGEPRIVVPETSVVYTLYGESVFEVVPAGQNTLRVERRSITTGAHQDAWVQVHGALNPGALVVVNGQHKLNEGSPVSLADAPAMLSESETVKPTRP